MPLRSSPPPVSRFAKALAVTAVGATAILATLVYAVVSARHPLTSNALERITTEVLQEMVEEAIESGGVEHAETLLEERLASRLSVPVEVSRLARPLLSPPFGFRVTAGEASAWVSPEGLIDPLAAMRSGERHRIHMDSVTIGPGHSNAEALARCLTARWFHAALAAPDLFARLENRTVSDGHGGFEALVVRDGGIALDRFALGGLDTPPEALLPYGL